MKKMPHLECNICGKEIVGYSKKHIDYLMLQHKLTHRKAQKKEVDWTTLEEEKQ